MIYTYALSILLNPIFIYSRIWRYIYLPLVQYFNLPTDNHNNFGNSHILSLVYSIIMTLITPYSYYLLYNNYWNESQINSYVTSFIYNFSITYFASDLIIGMQYYPKILNSNILTSYIHHIAYIGLFAYGKYYNKNYLFIFGLPYEIPTILLNLGYINPKYKNYKLFGILFFIFRIIHNSYLLYRTWMVYNDLFIFCLFTFILHSNWFYGYVIKYLLSEVQNLAPYEAP